MKALLYYLIPSTYATETLPDILAIPSGTGVTETGDVGTFVAGIVTWILGILGIVMFCLFLYGGFTYMTAGGDSGKTEKAIGTIRDAIIGVIIIGLSWVISNTVLGFIFS